MSGVEALGLACSVMQVISFSQETIRLCINVYQGRSPDESLAGYASELQQSAVGIQDLQSNRHQVHKLPASARQLYDVADKCKVTARALEEEIKHVMKHQKDGDLVATIRVAAKSIWRKRRLNRLEKTLVDARTAMETQLLVQLYQEAKDNGTFQAEKFQALEDNYLKTFITKVSQGHTAMDELISKGFSQSRDHTSREIEDLDRKFQTHLDLHTSTLSSNLEKKTRRDRLLQSLKYPEMNDRGNQITESHDETFNWLFSSVGERTDNDCVDENGDTDSGYEDTYHHSVHGDSERKVSDTVDPSPYPNIRWDRFDEWLRSESDIYWMSGKPGSGKSTLVKKALSDIRTQEALQVWRDDTVILSHFFWKAGSSMQNSIKGMYCHILHQAFSVLQQKDIIDPVIEQIMARQPGIRSKDTTYDWSLPELSQLALQVLEEYPSPVCLFVDGLDEISSTDGPQALLRAISQIRSIESVKICLSSRPEIAFRRVLEKEQHLKLHDLNEQDLERFARSRIDSMRNEHEDAGSLDHVLEILIRKADGVFLWLHLALNQIEHGLEGEDSALELEQRVDQLPDELMDLYSDMWTRQNGQSKIYQQAATHCLNLMVTRTQLIDIESEDYDEGPPAIGLIFAFAELSDPGLFQRLWNDTVIDIDPTPFQEQIEKAARDIQNRSAGLLTVREDSEGQHDVNFIHRSAYTFLLETSRGADIRAHGSYSREEYILRLIRGGSMTKAQNSPWRSCIDDSYMRGFRHISDPANRLRGKIVEVLSVETRAYWKRESNRIRHEKSLFHFYHSFLYNSDPVISFLIDDLESHPKPQAAAAACLLVLLDRIFNDDEHEWSIKDHYAFIQKLFTRSDPLQKGIYTKRRMEGFLEQFDCPWGYFLKTTVSDLDFSHLSEFSHGLLEMLEGPQREHVLHQKTSFCIGVWQDTGGGYFPTGGDIKLCHATPYESDGQKFVLAPDNFCLALEVDLAYLLDVIFSDKSPWCSDPNKFSNGALTHIRANIDKALGPAEAHENSYRGTVTARFVQAFPEGHGSGSHMDKYFAAFEKDDTTSKRISAIIKPALIEKFILAGTGCNAAKRVYAKELVTIAGEHFELNWKRGSIEKLLAEEELGLCKAWLDPEVYRDRGY